MSFFSSPHKSVSLQLKKTEQPCRVMKLLPPQLCLQEQLWASLVEAAEGCHLQPISPSASEISHVGQSVLVQPASASHSWEGFGSSAQAVRIASLRIQSRLNSWKTNTSHHFILWKAVKPVGRPKLISSITKTEHMAFNSPCSMHVLERHRAATSLTVTSSRKQIK